MAPAGSQGVLHSKGDTEMGYDQLRCVCASVHVHTYEYVCVPAHAEKDTSWKMPVAACIRVSGRAATTKHDRLVAYKQQKLFLMVTEAGIQNQGVTLFLAHRRLPRYPHRADKVSWLPGLV